MYVTSDSHGSLLASALVILALALAVLGIVHMLTTFQLPDSVPDCGKAEVLDSMTLTCDRVAP